MAKMFETSDYTGLVPSLGHRRFGYNLAKPSVKEGIQGQRIAHLVDPLWANWLRTTFHEGDEEVVVPSWAGGFERGRRWENAIAVAQITLWKLTNSKKSCCLFYFDVTNAFACADRDRLK